MNGMTIFLKRRRRAILWTVGLFFFVTLEAQSIERSTVEEAANLASAILQRHPNMMDENARIHLDRLNRSLREALAFERRSQSDEDRRDALSQTPGLLEDLRATLDAAMPQTRFLIDETQAVLQTDARVELPGDQGAILLRIDAQGEGTRFISLEMDSETYPEHRRVGVEIASTGTTWALLEIERAPKAQMTLMLDLTRPDAPSVPALLTVATPEPARLLLTALCDENDEPTPAMIRLTWKTNGRDRMPSNAVAIEPLMDRQGQPRSRRDARLPGDWGGPYWCIPESFDMEIPPGEWEIIIRRGVEHIPIRETFTVDSGQLVEKVYRIERWVDMPRRGWYSGDEHVHARMASDADAAILMAWARAEDIHVSNVVLMGDVHRTWFQQRGWGPEFRVQMNNHALSPGQEDPRTHQELGHTIHMNTTGMIRDVDRYFLYDWTFERARSQGGLSGFCHVLFNMFEVHRGMALFVPFEFVDFIEIMQFNQMGTDLYYQFLNLGFPLTVAAGSDVPWGGTVGEVRMYAHLGDAPFNVDAWFEAVRAGRVFVTNGPMLDLRVNDAMPGDTLTLEPNAPVLISASALGHPERFLPTALEIVANGEVIHRIENENRDAELRVEMEWDADYGAWIAIRAFGDDGSQAHTTPVYATRPGFRFWKIDEAEQLIERRMASLNDIVEMAARYRVDLENDPTNLTKRLFVAQAPELLERVEMAQHYYAELKERVDRERELRASD